MVVTDNVRVIRQLRVTGAGSAIGEHNVYRSTPFIGQALRQAYDDAAAWIDANTEKETDDA